MIVRSQLNLAVCNIISHGTDNYSNNITCTF